MGFCWLNMTFYAIRGTRTLTHKGKQPGHVVQLVASPNLIADPGVVSLILVPYFHGDDQEIFSTVILLLPLITEWLMSVTSESMCTKY